LTTKLKLISCPEDLVTTSEETRKGFLKIALRKGRESDPFIEEARALKTLAEKCDDILNLLSVNNLRPKLGQAAGISEKAFKYLNDKDIDDIILDFFEKYIVASENPVEDLVYRYLLANGDSLGGKMRNIIGKFAQEQFVKKVLAILRLETIHTEAFVKRFKNWVSLERIATDDYIDITSISYENEIGPRVLTFNKTIPTVGKNVDMALLETIRPKSQLDKHTLRNPSLYKAFGELKGGYDPAGADEHWKTARTSLSRIRTSFEDQGLNVKTFFIGAAIERSMAEEIYSDFKDSKLSFCANLNKPGQLESLCREVVTN
jgi:hypothetical protein